MYQKDTAGAGWEKQPHKRFVWRPGPRDTQQGSEAQGESAQREGVGGGIPFHSPRKWD